MEDGLQGRITWYRGKVRYSTSQLESHGNYKPFGRGLTISGLGHVLILVIYHLLTGVDPGIRRAGGSQDLFSCGKYGDLKGMSTLGRMEHSKWFQIAATNVIFESLGASMKEFLIYGSWHRWGISFTSGKSSIFRQRFWKYHNFSRFIQFILSCHTSPTTKNCKTVGMSNFCFLSIQKHHYSGSMCIPPEYFSREWGAALYGPPRNCHSMQNPGPDRGGHPYLGGDNSNILSFSPRIPGEDEPIFAEHIVQMGWVETSN